MRVERGEGKYFPRSPYVRLKERAIKQEYEILGPDERASVDELVDRVLKEHLRGMGRGIALEFVGSVAIKLAENPQLK